MTKVVVGLYDHVEDARSAVEALVNGGFRREGISLIAADTQGEYRRDTASEEGETAAGGAAAGAGIGAALGGLGGLLVGLGALTIPGIGPVLAAGPLISALAGAGIGAAAGGLIGALVDLGIPTEQAEKYAEGVRRGGTLVSVMAPDERSGQAADLMNRFNPMDVDERYETWRAAPVEDRRRDPAAQGLGSGETGGRAGDRSDVAAEELRAGKRQGVPGDLDKWEPMFRSHFQTTYSHLGRSYEDFRPAYTYGYGLAYDPRYQDRDWRALEPEARLDWERSHLDQPWEDFKDAVRQAWMAVTGQA